MCPVRTGHIPDILNREEHCYSVFIVRQVVVIFCKWACRELRFSTLAQKKTHLLLTNYWLIMSHALNVELAREDPDGQCSLTPP